MSDNCLHIVPKHKGDYPDSEQKAKEILAWFQDRDMVENHLSDCILATDKKGYRFKPNIAAIFKDAQGQAYSDTLLTHGLELTYGKRTIFHPLEGMYLIIRCPHCGKDIDEDTGFHWIADWYENQGKDYPVCPHCQEKRHLTEYDIEPEWAFSNLGISLWNTHWDLKPELLTAMEDLLGTEVVVVPVRI